MTTCQQILNQSLSLNQTLFLFSCFVIWPSQFKLILWNITSADIPPSGSCNALETSQNMTVPDMVNVQFEIIIFKWPFPTSLFYSYQYSWQYTFHKNIANNRIGTADLGVGCDRSTNCSYWGAAIVQWICLRLPSCRPARVWVPSFIVKIVLHCLCIVNRTKTNKKRPGKAFLTIFLYKRDWFETHLSVIWLLLHCYWPNFYNIDTGLFLFCCFMFTRRKCLYVEHLDSK